MTSVNSNNLFDKKNGESDLTKIVHSLVSRADSGIVTLAPGIAWRVLDELNFDGQRKVKKSRMESRLTAIRKGEWDAQASTITIAEMPDGSMHLIDGQHRLYAIYTHDAPVQTRLNIVKASDGDHLRRMYSLFDMKDSSRTDAELLSASGMAELFGIRMKAAQAVIGAMAVIENRMEPDTRNAPRLNQFSVRHETALNWDSEARIADEMIIAGDTAIGNKLVRAGTMAVMLYTIRHQRIKAIDFWTGVCDGNGLRKYDPRNRLRIDLLSRNVRTGNRRQIIQQSALAWNAHFEGRDLKIIKCIEGAEIAIQGTPMRKGGAR